MLVVLLRFSSSNFDTFFRGSRVGFEDDPDSGYDNRSSCYT